MRPPRIVRSPVLVVSSTTSPIAAAPPWWYAYTARATVNAQVPMIEPAHASWSLRSPRLA